MITGIITAAREAVIQRAVRRPSGPAVAVDAVIDTGFTGWLALPTSPTLPMTLHTHAAMASAIARGCSNTSHFDLSDESCAMPQPRSEYMHL
jgi:predicted aspartyl protease